MPNPSKEKSYELTALSIEIPIDTPTIQAQFDTFPRTASHQRLLAKMSRQEPLTVHLLVPLCDNENQGIVPVGRTLGDGLNLRTNLYWGAKYGMKSFFKSSSEWQFIQSDKKTDQDILERAIFYRQYTNGNQVYLIMDAYRGDRMKETLEVFFRYLTGDREDQITVDSNLLKIGKNADLLVLNGHNGLMDYPMEIVPSVDGKEREVSVLGCVSYSYFEDHLKAGKGYPLLMTTNLMAPEAYVLNSLIDWWVEENPNRDPVEMAGAAYHKYQKCGLRGAKKLFCTGWRPH